MLFGDVIVAEGTVEGTGPKILLGSILAIVNTLLGENGNNPEPRNLFVALSGTTHFFHAFLKKLS